METMTDSCSGCCQYTKIMKDGGRWLCKVCIHFRDRAAGDLQVVAIGDEEKIGEGVWEDGEPIHYRQLGTGKDQ